MIIPRIDRLNNFFNRNKTKRKVSMINGKIIFFRRTRMLAFVGDDPCLII